MLVKDAQLEVRTVFIGGFWGQLVSSIIWLTSAALATWATPRAAIIQIVVSGFFIFPLVRLMLLISGKPSYTSKANPLGYLGMQVALSLPFTMLLLAPVTAFHLNWFYPALMILLGAHYLPFTFLYGMRIFIALAAILIGAGVAIAYYPTASFSLGGWVAGVTLFLFAWIGRASIQAELRPRN